MNRFLNVVSQNNEIFIIVIFASILRFYHLDFQSAWLDEIYTMNIANPNVSFSTTIDEINVREGFPYLYFLTLKALFALFGYEPLVARVFSAIFGIASVYAVFKIGKLLFTKNAGLIAALFLAISDYAIYISQDARPYTFYMFCVILSFYALVKFLKDSTTRTAIIYGLSIALLLNSNFFSFVNLFTHAAIIVYFIIINDKSSRVNLFKKALISAVIGILLFVPNYRIFQKIISFKSNWIPAPTSESLTLIFTEFLGNNEITSFLFLTLFLFFLFNIFRSEPLNNQTSIVHNKYHFTSVILVAWIGLFIAVIYVRSYISASMMIARYWVSLVPALFLILGIAVDQIRVKFLKWIAISVVSFFMLANLLFVKDYYNVPSKTQFREVAKFVVENNTDDTPIFTSLKYWFDFYFFINQYTNLTIERPTLDAVIAEKLSDTTAIKSFWYIDAHSRPFKITDETKSFLDKNYYNAKSINLLDAYAKLYVPKSEMSLSVDLDQYKPLKTQNGHKIECNLEIFEFSNNVLKVNGWAFLDNVDSADSELSLLLISEKTAVRLPTEIQMRPDVSLFFNQKVSNAGFSINSKIEDIPPGTYSVGVIIKNKDIEGIFVTDKNVVVN